MNLLFAIKSLGLRGGGAERVFANVVNGLALRGHRVCVTSFDPPDSAPFYPIDPRVERLSLGVGRVDRPTTIAEMIARVAALRMTVLPRKPDIAVGFMHSTYIPLGTALKGSGIPVVASEHTVPAHYRTRHVDRLLLRLAPALTQTITVVSEQARESFPKWIRNHMIVVPNLVQTRVQKKADLLLNGRGRKTLLSVGRLSIEKDFKTLIQAFSILAPKLPEWDLRIIGDGVERPKLEKLIFELNLHGRISMPGYTEAIDDEYASAQLFVLPSLYESLGLVVIEAMAHGLPAVGFSDCPGVNGLISHGRNGLLVDSQEERPAALAKALSLLMADDQLRAQMKPDDSSGTAPGANCEQILDVWEIVLGKAIR